MLLLGLGLLGPVVFRKEDSIDGCRQRLHRRQRHLQRQQLRGQRHTHAARVRLQQQLHPAVGWGQQRRSVGAAQAWEADVEGEGRCCRHQGTTMLVRSGHRKHPLCCWSSAQYKHSSAHLCAAQ